MTEEGEYINSVPLKLHILNWYSIPTRRELVRDAAQGPSTAQVKSAQREVQEHHWTTCPLSHGPLKRPIVSDCVGNLYNKDAILKFLLPGDEAEGISSKADCEEILCGRVKGLRDVVELKFEVDTERVDHVVSAAAGHEKREGWICPVTAKQLGPNVKSVYLVPCGHVFSEEAVRQLKGDKCLQVRSLSFLSIHNFWVVSSINSAKNPTPKTT